MLCYQSKLAATSMTLIHVEPWSVNGKAGENGASYGATFTIAGGVSVNEVTGAMALACSDIDGCSSVSDNLRAFAPIGRVADDDEGIILIDELCNELRIASNLDLFSFLL